MKPENKAFLDANRHHYETLTKAFYMKGLNAHERDGMVRVMREEFIPNYHTDLWCSPCVADMVKLLYHKYNEWLAAQPKEVTVKATFPKHESDTSNSNNIPKRNHRRR